MVVYSGGYSGGIRGVAMRQQRCFASHSTCKYNQSANSSLFLKKYIYSSFSNSDNVIIIKPIQSRGKGGGI